MVVVPIGQFPDGDLADFRCVQDVAATSMAATRQQNAAGILIMFLFMRCQMSDKPILSNCCPSNTCKAAISEAVSGDVTEAAAPLAVAAVSCAMPATCPAGAGTYYVKVKKNADGTCSAFYDLV